MPWFRRLERDTISAFGSAVSVRPKIVVATPWPVWPLINGRRTKAFARCIAWSSVADVEIVSAGASAVDAGEFALGRGIVERRVPFFTDRTEIEATPFTLAGQRSMFFPLHAFANVDYQRMLRTVMESAQGVVACTPFTYRIVRATTRLPVLLDAQVVEVDAVYDELADDALAVTGRRLIAEIEREAFGGADVVLTADVYQDMAAGALRQSTQVTFAALPSLFRSTDVLPGPQARRDLKARSNFAGAPLVLFAGSQTRGNQASIEVLIRLATRLPGLRFLAIGSIVEAVRGRSLPPNLGFTGVIDDAQFTAALTFADLGIELGTVISGVSAKIDAYIRCGTPVAADPEIATKSGLLDGMYAPATEESVVDCVMRIMETPALADESAARAFRFFYERAMTRVDVTALAALLSSS